MLGNDSDADGDVLQTRAYATPLSAGVLLGLPLATSAATIAGDVACRW